MSAEFVGTILHGLSEMWAPGDKPVKRRRVILIFTVAVTLSTVLALIAYTDVL